jgi:parvulin-like peptidyl-prolyl isomerase
MFGCFSQEPENNFQQHAGHAGSSTANTVAVVNGRPILIEDVLELMKLTSPEKSPTSKEVLEALIRNELLFEQAKKRGLAKRAEVEDERKVAMARLLLENRIGQGVSPETIDRIKLRQFYEANKPKYVHADQRVVHHILVHDPDNTGSTDEPSSQFIAQEARQSLGATATLDQMKLVSQTLTDKYPGRTRREELPPFSADDANFVKPFVDAIFALPGNGAVSNPFQTSFGWHVALVVEEIPSSNQSFENIEDELATQVVPEEKKLRYRQLIDQLEQDIGVFVYDEVIAQWLATPEER